MKEGEAMQDWDHFVMILLGAGVTAHTGYLGWQFWKQQNRSGAAGAFFLAALTVALPIALAVVVG